MFSQNLNQFDTSWFMKLLAPPVLHWPGKNTLCKPQRKKTNRFLWVFLTYGWQIEFFLISNQSFFCFKICFYFQNWYCFDSICWSIYNNSLLIRRFYVHSITLIFLIILYFLSYIHSIISYLFNNFMFIDYLISD